MKNMNDINKKENNEVSMIHRIIIFILLALFAYFVVTNFTNIPNNIEKDKLKEEKKELIQKQEKIQDVQLIQLLTKVNKLILLPQNIKPNIAEVTDPSTLKKEQAFFKNAKKGDILIIYPDRVIIYDPVANRLINVGPIIDKNNPARDSVIENKQNEITSVEIRNGSGVNGAAAKFAEQLNDSFNVVKTTDAANDSYEKTILVNLDSKDVSALEKVMNVTAIKELPENEAKSSADIVIILGKK